MKKKILTLVAAALFTQVSVSQTITDSTTTVNTTENTTIAQNAQNVEKVVFKNRSSGKEYEVSLPATNRVFFKNVSDRKKYLPRAVFLLGNQGNTIITRIDTSFVVVKFHPPMKWNELRSHEKEIRQIQKDRTLSQQEKEKKYFDLTYSDSVSIPKDAIKNIRFSKFNRTDKRFYKYGFNEHLKHQTAISLLSQVPRDVLIVSYVYLFATGVVTLPVTCFLVAGTLVTSAIIEHYAFTKKIDLNKWEIK